MVLGIVDVFMSGMVVSRAVTRAYPHWGLIAVAAVSFVIGVGVVNWTVATGR
jgi:hypothetical protein